LTRVRGTLIKAVYLTYNTTETCGAAADEGTHRVETLTRKEKKKKKK
jgi:hypothetical protein